MSTLDTSQNGQLDLDAQITSPSISQKPAIVRSARSVELERPKSSRSSPRFREPFTVADTPLSFFYLFYSLSCSLLVAVVRLSMATTRARAFNLQRLHSMPDRKGQFTLWRFADTQGLDTDALHRCRRRCSAVPTLQASESRVSPYRISLVCPAAHLRFLGVFLKSTGKSHLVFVPRRRGLLPFLGFFG